MPQPSASGAEHRSGGTDAAHACGVVQRRDLAKRVEGIDHLLIDVNGAGEPVAAVNDSVSYSIEDPKLRMRVNHSMTLPTASS